MGGVGSGLGRIRGVRVVVNKDLKLLWKCKKIIGESGRG